MLCDCLFGRLVNFFCEFVLSGPCWHTGRGWELGILSHLPPPSLLACHGFSAAHLLSLPQAWGVNVGTLWSGGPWLGCGWAAGVARHLCRSVLT